MNVVPPFPSPSAPAVPPAAPASDPDYELGDILVAAPTNWMMQPGSRWEVVGADHQRAVYQLRPEGCPGAGWVTVSGPTLAGQIMRDRARSTDNAWLATLRAALFRPTVIIHNPDDPLFSITPGNLLPHLDAEPRLFVEIAAQFCSWCGTGIPAGVPRWVNLWAMHGEAALCRLHQACHVAAETITPSGEWVGRPLEDIEDDELDRVQIDMPEALLPEWRTVLHALNIPEPAEPTLDEFPPAGSVWTSVSLEGVVEYSPNGRRWRLLFDLEKCPPGTSAEGSWQYGAVPAPWRQVAE
jgi:hypothetical protein